MAVAVASAGMTLRKWRGVIYEYWLEALSASTEHVKRVYASMAKGGSSAVLRFRSSVRPRRWYCCLLPSKLIVSYDGKWRHLPHLHHLPSLTTSS